MAHPSNRKLSIGFLRNTCVDLQSDGYKEQRKAAVIIY